MWGLSEYESHILSLASLRRVTHNIHVLLADHDLSFAVSTVEMLQRYSYKVTWVNCASAALTILSLKREKYDVIIANIHSPDLQGVKLLRQAVSMQLLVILLSDTDDANMAARALEQGAFLLLAKPAVCEDTWKNLWQYVMRERITRAKEMEKIGEVILKNNGDNKGKGLLIRNDHYSEEMNNNNNIVDEKGWCYKIRGKGPTAKRKPCTEWTVELHQKFMDAVYQLGDGKCYPKEILELMNVPGLTRMQVASHLQKCRNADWRVPEERKVPTSSVSTAAGSAQKSQTRRFGAMPRLAGSSVRHRSPTRQHQENPKSAESPSSPSINGVMRVEMSHEPLQSSQYLTVRSPGPSSPQSVAQPVRSADGTTGKSQIVGSIDYRSGDLRVNSHEMDVRSDDGNNCGVFNSLIPNFPIGEKYGFSDDPSNTCAGIDCYATTTHPPPLYHRRVISDDVFGLSDVDHQYPFQCFSDHYARLGGGQAESSSRFDTGFNVCQKEAMVRPVTPVSRGDEDSYGRQFL